MRHPAIALLSLALLAASQNTKQPSLPTLGETIEVSIVNVDVYVTDKSGHRARGLTREDFDVFENGVRQPITNFAEYARDEPAAAPQSGAPAERATEAAPVSQQKRTVVVFVEQFRLPSVKSDPLFAAMKKLLHETIRTGDAAMIVTWTRRSLRTIQPYTDDLAAIDRAVDGLARQSRSAVHDDYGEARVQAADVEDFEIQSEEVAQEAISSLGGDPAPIIAAMRQGAGEMQGLSARMDALRARGELEQKVRTLNALMRSMAGLEGKRVLLMATHRLSKIAGAEFFWAGGVQDSLDSLDRIEFDTRNTIRTLYQTANTNGVTIYPMFPEGLGSSGARVPVASRTENAGVSAIDYLIQSNETPVLQEVARQTGGIPAWGAGDAERLLAAVRDDFDTYYSLAYRTTPRSLDRARSIVVKTRNPNLVVRSRREVIEKSDQTRMEDRVLASLFREQSNARLRFAVKLGERRGGAKKFRIPVTVRVPISALTMLPNGPNFSGGFSVYVAWTGKIGGVGDATHETKLFHIPQDEIKRARRSYFTYQFEIAADGHTDRLSLAVVDEVSREFGVRVFDLGSQIAGALPK